jgi:hypothetical protein
MAATSAAPAVKRAVEEDWGREEHLKYKLHYSEQFKAQEGGPGQRQNQSANNGCPWWDSHDGGTLRSQPPSSKTTPDAPVIFHADLK